ncbi:unnamed protein product, partial [Oppiella nova]
MKLVLILGFIALSSALSISRQEVDNEWQKFKHEYRKNQYYANSNEEALRKQIFADTYDMIVRHNKEADEGIHTYRLGVNQFSDITDEEYRQMLTLDVSGLEGQQTYDKKPYSIKAQLPESVDWRDKKVVTAVKTQGSFVPPLDKEENYPYKGVYQNCSYQAKYSGASITGYTNVTSGDEDALKEAIATNGPVVVSIDASLSTFKNFNGSGVYNDKQCKSAFKDLNHDMVAVGYGTENGQDYYIVKNSFGTTFGDHGYIKMARNANNNCGIATYALYPTGVQ